MRSLHGPMSPRSVTSVALAPSRRDVVVCALMVAVSLDYFLTQPLRLLTAAARITTEVVEQPENVDSSEVIDLLAKYQRCVVSRLGEDHVMTILDNLCSGRERGFLESTVSPTQTSVTEIAVTNGARVAAAAAPVTAWSTPASVSVRPSAAVSVRGSLAQPERPDLLHAADRRTSSAHKSNNAARSVTRRTRFGPAPSAATTFSRSSLSRRRCANPTVLRLRPPDRGLPTAFPARGAGPGPRPRPSP